MGYTTVVAGTTITASWANANVRDQVVTPFATTSARTSAITAPIEGMVAPITGDDQISVYDGATWQRHSWYKAAGRIGCVLARTAAQSIANNTLTAITWDTETSDPQGFIAVSSSTLTVPSGYDGIYMARLRATTGSAVGVEFAQMLIDATEHDNTGTNGGGTNHDTTFGPYAIAAAQTIVFKIRHQIGSTQNLTFGLELYRIAI